MSRFFKALGLCIILSAAGIANRADACGWGCGWGWFRPRIVYRCQTCYTCTSCQQIQNQATCEGYQWAPTEEELPPAPEDPTLAEIEESIEQEEARRNRPIVERINKRREVMGLPPLKEDGPLSRACEAHAQRMAAWGMYHDGGAGCAECIAQGQYDSDAALNAWFNSPPHAAIIFSRGTRIGFGKCGRSFVLRVR